MGRIGDIRELWDCAMAPGPGFRARAARRPALPAALLELLRIRTLPTLALLALGYLELAGAYDRARNLEGPLWSQLGSRLPDHKLILVDHQADAGFEATNVINACGRTRRFEEAAALLERCELAITPDTGLVLEWEGAPRQEREADALALRVLRRTGGPLAAEHFIECRQLAEHSRCGRRMEQRV